MRDIKAKQRAFSVIEIKELNEEERVITGMATTPAVDRMGDVVESKGAQFSLPFPLLWQHRSGAPVGNVEFADPTDKGIPFRARIAKVEEPGELKNMVDLAWQSVKHKLVRAVSIGFKIIDHEPMDAKDPWGAWRIKKWEWLELSLVTIPANAEATIHTIRSIDDDLLAAQRTTQVPSPQPARAVAPPVKMKEARMGKKTLAEQIAGFENTRAAKVARMQDIMDGAAEKGETLDKEVSDEYDGIGQELKSIDDHLTRLKVLETTNRSQAVVVEGTSPETADRSRGVVSGGNTSFPRVTMMAPKVEKAIGFTRYVIALTRAKGNIMAAAEIAKNNEQWMHETPLVAEVLKAAVAAGTTTDATWAGPLVNYQILVSEFAEFLRGQTIIGRIPGLRRVPFKVRVPRATGGSSVNWVGEGKVKPLSALAFDSITLDYAKIAGIVPLTDELVRASSPSAEQLVRDDLAAAVIAFMDSQFVDPSKAANDVSPASITNGVTAITPSGTTAIALRSDVRRLMSVFLANNLSLNSAVWIMTQQNALGISLLTNSLGQAEFPGISGTTGGTFVGLPVVASENIPSTTGSPTEGWPLILAKADEILLADDGQVTIDASREASLQMDTTPDSPATGTTTLVSLWQHNMMAIKAERYINWVKRRSTAVQYIAGAVYSG